METEKILDQIFSRRQPSLKQLIRDAIAKLPPHHQPMAKARLNDIHFCVLALFNYNKLPAQDGIEGTLAAIDFSDPNFKLDFKAIAAATPKRYLANSLPE